MPSSIVTGRLLSYCLDREYDEPVRTRSEVLANPIGVGDHKAHGDHIMIDIIIIVWLDDRIRIEASLLKAKIIGALERQPLIDLVDGAQSYLVHICVGIPR